MLLLLLFSQLSGGLSCSSGLWWSGNPQTRSGKDRSQATLRPGLWGSPQGWTGMSQREVNTGLFIHPHYYYFEHMSLTFVPWYALNLGYQHDVYVTVMCSDWRGWAGRELTNQRRRNWGVLKQNMIPLLLKWKRSELVKRLWHTYCICVKYSKIKFVSPLLWVHSAAQRGASKGQADSQRWGGGNEEGGVKADHRAAPTRRHHRLSEQRLVQHQAAGGASWTEGSWA